jgi:hypothetical protein
LEETLKAKAANSSKTLEPSSRITRLNTTKHSNFRTYRIF